jgi:nicotinamide-nucleotide amidase
MRHLFERYVATELAPRVQRTSAQVHIKTFGLRESEVAEKLADIDANGPLHRPGVTIGYRAHFPEIEVKVLGRAQDEPGASELANEVAAQVRERLGSAVYGGREDSYPAYVGALLRSRGLRLALAESCTGGLIGKLLTDVPGSSEYVLLDAVTYANSAKRDVLGVNATLLEQKGAVSAEVAAAMAEGVLHKASADLAVGVTGIAGPGGGSADKPVGTVFLALARRNEKTVTERIQAQGDRERVRTLTAYAALRLVAQTASAWPSRKSALP